MTTIPSYFLQLNADLEIRQLFFFLFKIVLYKVEQIIKLKFPSWLSG